MLPTSRFRRRIPKILMQSGIPAGIWIGYRQSKYFLDCLKDVDRDHVRSKAESVFIQMIRFLATMTEVNKDQRKKIIECLIPIVTKATIIAISKYNDTTISPILEEWSRVLKEEVFDVDSFVTMDILLNTRFNVVLDQLINFPCNFRENSTTAPETNKRKCDGRPGPISVNGYDEWEIEALSAKRFNQQRKTVQYMVVWKGWGKVGGVWYDVDDLGNATELIKEFEAKQSQLRRSGRRTRMFMR